MTEPPTDRELEVLDLLGRPGASYATVGHELRISAAMVGWHLKCLYRKLSPAEGNAISSALQAERKLYPDRRQRAA